MTPLEIKIALMRNGITQVKIAKHCQVHPSHVNRVIQGITVSDHVRRKIAGAIQKDVKEVWPEYYLRDVLCG